MQRAVIFVSCSLLVILTTQIGICGAGIWETLDAQFETEINSEIISILADNEKRAVAGEVYSEDAEINFDDSKRSLEAVQQLAWVPGMQQMGVGFDWVYGERRGRVIALNKKAGRIYSSPYNNRRYSLADEVFILNTPSATMVEEVEVFASINDYQKSRASSIGISLSVWNKGVLSRTSSTKRIGQLLTTSASRWTSIERTYTYYTMNMLPPDYLHLTRQIKADLAALPRFQDSTKATYAKFFQTYGTHVVIGALFGGQMSHESLLTTTSIGNRNQNWITQQLEYWWNWMLSDQPAQKALYQRNLDPKFVSSNTRTRFTFEGGNRTGLNPSDWQQWRRTIPSRPIMVTFRVRPIYEFVLPSTLRQDLQRAMIAYAQSYKNSNIKRAAQEYSTWDRKRDNPIDSDGTDNINERIASIPKTNFADVTENAAVVFSSSSARVCREISTYVYYKKIVCDQPYSAAEVISPDHPDTYFMFESNDTDKYLVIDLSQQRYLTSVGARVARNENSTRSNITATYYASLDSINWELCANGEISENHAVDSVSLMTTFIKPRAVRFLRVHFNVIDSSSSDLKVYSVVAEGPGSRASQSIGELEHISKTEARGWSLNLMDYDRPVTVEIYVDNILTGRSVTNQERPDVNQIVGSVGRHGFTIALNLAYEGCFDVRARFIGFNYGWSEDVGHRICTTSEPGRLTGATTTSVEGWAFSITRNNATASVPIEISIDGQAQASGSANMPNAAVNNMQGVIGNFGFKIPVNVSFGIHNITAYTTAGGQRLQLTDTIQVEREYPRGVCEQISATGITGWALDVHNIANEAVIVVYIDGVEHVRQSTDQYRWDITRQLNITGLHGFNIPFNLTGFMHAIDVYVVLDSNLELLCSDIVHVPLHSRSVMQTSNPLVDFLASGFDALTEEFRLPLFSFHYTQRRTFTSPYSNSVWRVPDEISVTANPSVIVKERNDVSNNVIEYLQKRTKKRGWSVGFFGRSKVSISVKQRLTQTSSRYVTHDRFYELFNSRFLPFNLKLSPYAADALAKLPAYSRNNRHAYDRFFAYFGTHFISRSKFGGRISMTLDIDTSLLVNSSQQFVAKQSGFKFKFLISVSGSWGSQKYKSQLDAKFAAHSRSEVRLIGGHPDRFTVAQSQRWAETIKSNPVMIDNELKEISELISDPRRRSDMHTAILDYMAGNWVVGTRCKTRTNYALESFGASVLSYSSILRGAPLDSVRNLVRRDNLVWRSNEQGFIFGDGDRSQRFVIDLGQLRNVVSIGVHVTPSRQPTWLT